MDATTERRNSCPGVSERGSVCQAVAKARVVALRREDRRNQAPVHPNKLVGNLAFCALCPHVQLPNV
jgi:hypothetical protein